MLDVATLSYVGAVVDLNANLTIRTVGQTELPNIAVHMPNMGVLRWLGDLTETKAIATHRDFMRAGCKEHCEEKHQHIRSTSGRWVLTGAKATVLLHNVMPYLRFQEVEARMLLSVGLRAPHKPATPQKMHALGWALPEWIDPLTNAAPLGS